MRIACVWLPHFPIAIERRNSPGLNRRAVIIGETTEQRGAVLDCSGEAEGQGVCVGMPLRQALGLCPSASFLPPDLPRYGDSFDQILRALETISPLVDPASLGCAFIGLGGLNGHYRDEMALGDALAQAVRRASALMPSVGLAQGKFTAQVAATVSAPGEVCLVPKGQEKKFLAPIDVSLLPCSRDTLRHLELFGLRTMGDLASLPMGAVQVQFGAEGRRIWELARGIDREPLRPLRREESIREHLAFYAPLISREALVTAGRDLAEEMARLPEFRDKLNAPLWRDLVALARQIDGFPRHVSQHVGGMIISSRPLVELVPVMPAAMPGRVVCQWDKDSVNDAGFIKIDFLALGMLSLVEECVELIAEHHGRYVDLSRIDFTDPAVYDMICAGDTVGVFQVESRAQMQMLPRTQPRSIEDLTVEVAIVRPGPIVGKAVNPYTQRRQGRQSVTYDHPSLKPVLEETLGVILFQEQVLQVALALAGFTAGQAETLRRAMSRKRSREAMESFWRQFRIGALKNGVNENTARTVFDKLLGFAEFGFPKSHAAAFALLAYQSAWLKKYYPAEFYCALLNAQPMGFYPPHVLTKDAQRHGIEVLSPDVSRSGARCTVDDGAVRIGFAYVQGIGQEAARALEDERQRSGVFPSLSDFVRRVSLKREPIENLISVGAFDQFGLNRRELQWQLGLLYRPSNGQFALPLPVEQDMVSLSEMTDWERMAADYGILALSPHYHPMGLMRPHLHEGIVPTTHLERLPDGTQVEVAGLVVCRQRPMTAKGFVFMLLEDEFGMANVVVKPQLYERYRSLVRAEPFVLVRGELQRRDGTTNVLAESFKTCPPAPDLGIDP